MKVYVITKGECYDYHICAVATDYEKACILQKKFSAKYGPAEIEEFDTEDFNDIYAKKNLYSVRFDSNGNVKSVYEKDIDYFDPKDNPVQACWGKEVLVNVFAFNKESAVKIAAEKRAMELIKRGYV
nr:MAG TPA: hypothetical protein [Caudoviricetes sp.]